MSEEEETQPIELADPDIIRNDSLSILSDVQEAAANAARNLKLSSRSRALSTFQIQSLQKIGNLVMDIDVHLQVKKEKDALSLLSEEEKLLLVARMMDELGVPKDLTGEIVKLIGDGKNE